MSGLIEVQSFNRKHFFLDTRFNVTGDDTITIAIDTVDCVILGIHRIRNVTLPENLINRRMVHNIKIR